MPITARGGMSQTYAVAPIWSFHDPFILNTAGTAVSNSYFRAFQDVVESLETAVPAGPENELIMTSPYVGDIPVRGLGRLRLAFGTFAIRIRFIGAILRGFLLRVRGIENFLLRPEIGVS